MRAAFPVPDAPQVLAPGVAVAGGPEALGLDGCRDAVEGIASIQAMPRWLARVRRRPAERGTTTAVGIGDGAVEELHLDPQDGPDADVLGRLGEPDRAVQALVVGERHRHEPQLLPAPDQLVHARGAIEEREVGMDVQVRPRTWLAHGCGQRL